MYKEIIRCRICHNEHLVSIIDLGSMALTGLFPKPASQAVPFGPLELVKCMPDDGDPGEVCGLVQLRHTFDPEQLFLTSYGYRSGLNASMVRHLQETVARISDYIALKPGDIVLDIGSNDGTLLKAYPALGLRRIGIDPTGHKFKKYYPTDIELIPDFFSAANFRANCGDAQARVITSIAMFYDLEAPMEFVDQIRQCLASDGIWAFEQSYLPAMLAHDSYDTICHEHLEFYTLTQVKWMLDRARLKIIDLAFSDVNGGSFAITAAHQDSAYAETSDRIAEVLQQEQQAGYNDLAIYHAFSERTARHAQELKALLRSLAEQGKKVLGYGASTKGNVTLQHCHITPDDLPCIAEVNEDKFGAATPGSRIPIVSEAEAHALNPDYFLVLPWHFRDAIIERERDFLARGGGLIFPLPKIEIVRHSTLLGEST